MDLLLSKWGHQVFVADSAAAGLEIIKQTHIKLVLVDIFLKDMMGYDLIPRIKAFSPDIKIITMTGSSSREVESRVRTLGVLYYLIKPFEIRNLSAIINHIEPQTTESNIKATIH